MVIFPNCKINLGLRILRKRPDGYHDLETVFYPVPLKDALEIISAPSGDDILFTQSGLTIQGSHNDNLCVKAYQLLRDQYPQIPPVQMHLHKNIPMGAGLGGGSADGAFTLQLLNTKYHLELSKEQLIGYALKLGSDCPFFISNSPSFAAGRGELLEELPLDLSAYSFLLVHPGIHISTSEAFSLIRPAIPEKSCKEIVQLPIAHWKKALINDFEEPVFAKYGELRNVKDRLYELGALYASMSGSGSSFYGIFEKNQIPLSPFADKGYRVDIIR